MARELWDGSYAKNFQKTEFYIVYEVHGNTIIKDCRPHVFFIPISSKPPEKIVEHGPFPEITKLPPAPPDREPIKLADDYPRQTSPDYAAPSYSPTEAGQGTAPNKPSLWSQFKRWLGA